MTRTQIKTIRDRIRLTPPARFVFGAFARLAIQFGLAASEAWFFKVNWRKANQTAAVRRLQHLESGRALEEYDFQNEAFVCGYER